MEAFACLADRHRGMVAALARRLLGTDDPVADVTQEATVAALVSLGRLRSPRQFEKEVPAMSAAAESAWVEAEMIDVCRSDGPDDPSSPAARRRAPGTKRYPPVSDVHGVSRGYCPGVQPRRCRDAPAHDLPARRELARCRRVTADRGTNHSPGRKRLLCRGGCRGPGWGRRGRCPSE